MKQCDVVDGAGDDDGHDGDPHAVHDVALHRAVDEDAVADQSVVVEIAADDRRAEVNDDDGSRDSSPWRRTTLLLLQPVNDDAGDVDDGDAEEHTADARTTLNADVLLAATTTFQSRPFYVS